MSATEELRRMLDERGVKYETNEDERAWEEPERTAWEYTQCGYEMYVVATEAIDVKGKPYLYLDFHHYHTPEQAIAATLGGGECEYVIEDNINETEGMGDIWFRCTNCDTTFDYYADYWLFEQNFCPHCGCKIRKAAER